MNNRQIFQIVNYYKNKLKPSYTKPDTGEIEPYQPPYSANEIPEFIHDLTEAANRAHIIMLENSLPEKEFPRYLKDMKTPLLAFEETSEGLVPVNLTMKEKGGSWKATFFKADGAVEERAVAPASLSLYRNEEGNILFMAALSFDSLVSQNIDEKEAGKHSTPAQRLLRLLKSERKDIIYIYIYAIFAGIITLALPLGIQAIIGLISGGLMFSSVFLLIGLVILAVLINGGLQIMQMSMVEILQRRIFTKAAYEFSFRIPRLKAEAIMKEYAPELVNRFFDILTIQKGLPKLLIDISSAVLQILFGLILLAFYHPFFIFFGIVLLVTLGMIFYFTGPGGLKTSLIESKYKYKVVFWLEEMARTLTAFKMAGNSRLPTRRADQNVNNYLHYRTLHFRVLIGQYRYIVLFKTLVTGGLLIIGSLLVMDRQITLGQFVASEIVIILILNAVEKIIMYMDTVYDMLTAVEKIGHVTDLPLERSGGISVPKQFLGNALDVRIKDLKYKYEDRGMQGLDGINLNIKAGEKLGVTGYNQAGKTTLVHILAGIYTNFEGSVTYNGFSLRDLDLINMRDFIAKNVTDDDIFDGTILDNIGVGKATIHYPEIITAIEMVGLSDFVNKLPEGLHTHITSGGKGFPESVVQKMILARCIAKQPKMLILNDYFTSFTKDEKIKLMKMLTSEKAPWTFLTVTSDPVILEACDQVAILKEGKLLKKATYAALMEDQVFRDIIGAK